MHIGYVPLDTKTRQILTILHDQQGLAPDRYSLHIKPEEFLAWIPSLTRQELAYLLFQLFEQGLFEYAFLDRKGYELAMTKDKYSGYPGTVFSPPILLTKENLEDHPQLLERAHGIRIDPDREKIASLVSSTPPIQTASGRGDSDEERAPDGTCTVLDTKVSLRDSGDRCGFHYEVDGHWFFVSLPPLEVRIIQHLYGIRRNRGLDRAKTIRELALVLPNSQTNKPSTSKSISTHILNIRTKCRGRIDPIVVSISKEKWALNPHFSSVVEAAGTSPPHSPVEPPEAR